MDERARQGTDRGNGAGNGPISVGPITHGTGIAIGPGATATVISEDLSYDVGGLPNPYLGLHHFTYDLRNRHAGREREVGEALGLLTAAGDERVALFVTGASGSGKSSFAQAGLVPALEQHYRQLGKTPTWAVFRPARFPLAHLASALVQLGLPQQSDTTNPLAALGTPEAFNRFVESQTPREQVNLLVIDQLEELFTQSDPVQREALFALLGGTSSFVRLRTHVIATLRADYSPNLFEHGTLFSLWKQQSVELRAMTRDELGRAVQRPVQEQYERLGGDKRWQPELVERLVADTVNDVTFLPLLQVTLEAIWTKGKLTLDRYGTLTDALQEHADAVYTDHGRRPELERAAILALFLDLVRVSLDDDPRHDARRGVLKADLTPGQADCSSLVEELVEARLLSVSTEQRGQEQVEVVDIIHETLLSRWGRLHQAIQDEREALRHRERFHLALQDWIDHDRSDRYVLKDVRLAEARALALRGDIVLRDPQAKALLDRSNATEEAGRRRTERTRLAVAGVFVAVLAIALIASIVQRGEVQQANRGLSTAVVEQEVQKQAAVVAKATAETGAQIAESRQLAAQSVTQLPIQLDLALLLAAEAYHLSPTVEARGNLLSAVIHTSRMIGPLRDHADSVLSVAFSPDGKTFASASADQTIILWDFATRQPIGTPLEGHTQAVRSVAFSPDGKTLASASYDKTVILWDLATRLAIGTPLKGQTEPVWSVAFSPDGNTLASASYDKTVILWHVDVGAWMVRVCNVANRNFTSDEWREYAGDRPYHKTCSE